MDDVINENVMKPIEIAFEARKIAKEWLKRDGWNHIKEIIKGRFRYYIATKGDKNMVFIVKGTTGSKNNFGAVTLTAFKVIFEYKENCMFLLVDITNNNVDTIELEKMLHYMFIPPFKIDFVINKEIRNDRKEDVLNDINNMITYYNKYKQRSIK